MMPVSNDELYQLFLEIQEQVQELKSISFEQDVKPYKLYKAARILGMSSEKLLDKIRNKEIDAYVEESNHSYSGETYLITGEAIRKYQKHKKYIAQRTAEIIAENKIQALSSTDYLKQIVKDFHNNRQRA